MQIATRWEKNIKYKIFSVPPKNMITINFNFGFKFEFENDSGRPQDNNNNKTHLTWAAGD